MNNTRILQVIFLVFLVVLAVFIIKKQDSSPNKQTPTPQPTANPDVIIDLPQPNTLVTSPMIVKGRARGGWFFEANIPVTLKDTNGNVLAQQGFQAIGNWMTSDYVEFHQSLPFTTSTTQYGVLIIAKDNPSGDPQNDESY